jgi:glycosyltransferase involved in cell wall biosynthesis
MLLNAVQLSCFVDPLGRDPCRLLAAWPTLVNVATAVASTGVRLSVVQAASTDIDIEMDEVTFHFVREQKPASVFGRAALWAAPLTRRVFRRVLALRPDVVHFQGFSYPRHIHVLSNLLNSVPLLVQDHADPHPPWWRRALSRRGLSRIDGVAFTARDQAEPWLRMGIFPPDLPIFEVLESSSTFSPGDQQEARARTGLRGDPCLLWLGHLDENKDPLTILEALSRVVDRLSDPQLWCCYLSAPLLSQVRERVSTDPALSARVHLLGSRPHEDIESLLRAADFLVQGSHREESGYAVIEALACGTTPLVTDIPSYRRITGEAAVGALSPPGDAGTMARALVEYSRRERCQLRQRARAHFEATLSFDVVGRDLRAAYEKLVERNGSTTRTRSE